MANRHELVESPADYPIELLVLLEEMQAQVTADLANGTVDDSTMAFMTMIEQPEILLEMVEQMAELEQSNAEMVD